MSRSARSSPKADRIARQRLARQQQAERERRRRMAWVSAVAVTVLVIAAIIGVGVWQANRTDDAAAPASAVADGHGVPVGDGPVTVEIYLDFLCPACAQFDAASRPLLEQYLADGTVTLVYRPIAILDQRTTTRFSTRAAAAAGCAADGGAVDEFVAAMMPRQPLEDTAGLSDDQIIEIGAGAGLDEAEFGQCVRDGTYLDWANSNTNASADRGVQGTPTLFVDGTPLDVATRDSLAAAVDAAAA